MESDRIVKIIDTDVNKLEANDIGALYELTRHKIIVAIPKFEMYIG